MSRQSVWATKVCALIQGGNSAAALAQIKVAPTARDLKDLRTLLQTTQLLAKHPGIDVAILDMVDALAGSRFHRSP